MKTVNMHEAKTHLSRLVEAASKGESFVIARAGKPLVKVTMVEEHVPRRIGFMEGEACAPEDFDTMFAEEIRAMFEDGPIFPDGLEE
jgi:prevent-host-death family protein